MTQMSGAEALAAVLAREGVDVVFGIPGVQIMDAVDAIYRAGKIRWISTRHEQTAVYMAYGYARTTAKISVALVLPGPGALNTTAAIGTARAAAAPVLLVSGQIESQHLGHHRGVLHELDEQLDIFRHLTKWSGRATKAADIPVLLQRALQELKTGCTQPVALEVPYDLWAQPAGASFREIKAAPLPPPQRADIKKAARLLKEARRPVILCGSGAVKSGVTAEITALAGRLKAPVVMTTEGQGVIPGDDPMCAGNFVLWLNPVFKATDCLLVVGSRLRALGNTQLKLRPDRKVIQVDCGAAELGRNHRIDLGIHADARAALKALLGELDDPGASLWQAEKIAAIRTGVRKHLEAAAPLQLAVISQIKEVLGDEGILVPDITNLGYWCDIAYPVNRPRTYVESSYFGTLGFAFPTALGAKVGSPDKAVVAVCGDGGFPYAATELATAVQEGINVVTLVFSDDAYGTVTGIQRRQFGGRYVGNRLHNPDYVKLAGAYGAVGVRLDSHEGLAQTLRAALDRGKPAVIEIPVPQLDTPWDTLIGDIG